MITDTDTYPGCETHHTLPGVKGDKGDKGDTGAPGATGPRGTQGRTGERGSNGTNGVNGAGLILAPAPSGGDDTAALNAFLANNAGKNVSLRSSATYLILGELTVPSDTVLDFNGATLDAAGMADATALGQRFAIRSTGTMGASVPVSLPLDVNSRIVAGLATTVGLLPGDMILLANEETPVPGLARSDRDKGELRIIATVDSGTQITLASGTVFAYGVAGLRIHKITPVKNVGIKNGKIIMGGAGSGHNGIRITYGRDIDISNMAVDGAEDQAIAFNSVLNGTITGGAISNSTSSATLGNTGYGVAIVEGSRNCLVNGVEFFNCRHFIAGGGYWPAIFNTVRDTKGIFSTNSAYDTHESCFYWTFTNNTASGVAIGFGMRGQYMVVEGNTISDCPGAAYQARTYDGVTEQRSIVFKNNTAIRCVAGIVFEGMAIGTDPNSLKIDGEIVGNIIIDCGNATGDAVIIRHFDGMKVIGNTVKRAGRSAFYILGLAGIQSKNLTIVANNVDNAVSFGYDINLVDDITYNGGEITAPTKHGINLTNCNRGSYNAVTVINPVNAGINISGGAKHSINNPMILGGTNTGFDAIRCAGSSDFSVIGGIIGSARNGIYSTATDYVIVQGVNARAATSGNKISVDATNKFVANNFV